MKKSLRQFVFLTATDQDQGLLSHLLKAFLEILSWGYYLGLNIILLGYRWGLLRRYKLPRPVISVGNITWGGVGKTPFVIWLAQKLRENQLKPVILTRGYRAQEKYGQKVSDEAKMLQEVLKDIPVLVGSNRVFLAKQFLKTHEVDVFLLDDGFQHWRLDRDMDIVLIDTTNPWGNQKLLPRGILREPLRALSRAHAVILTKIDLGQTNMVSIKNDLNKICPSVFMAETIHKPLVLEDLSNARRMELSILKNKRIGCLGSIGNPASFELTVKNLGAEVVKSYAFMDHHAYKKDEIENIKQACLEENISILVTTQKDAVKLASLENIFDGKINILCLHINIFFISGEDQFLERIHSIIHS